MLLSSALWFKPPGMVGGFVFDRSDTATRWVVGLFRNNELVDAQCADRFEPASGTGNCCYGFAFSLRPDRRASDIWDVRLINTPIVLGPVPVEETDGPGAAGSNAGTVSWSGGLSLQGFLDDGVTGDSSYSILAYHGADIVGQARVDRWQHIGNANDQAGHRLAFDLILDHELADGEPKTIHVRTSTGETLRGSPLQIVAYPNSFRKACLDQLPQGGTKAARHLLHSLVEHSAPLSAYDEMFPQLTSGLQHPGVLFGTTGRYVLEDGSSHVLVLHRDMHARADFLELLEAVSGDLAYFDFALDQGGKLAPVLLPAFDLERLAEQGYAGFAFAVRRHLFDTAMAGEPQTPLALFLGVLAALDASEVLHVPQPIGVLKLGDAAAESRLLARDVESHPALWGGPISLQAAEPGVLPRLRLSRAVPERSVSVLIPTRDNAGYLRRCTQTLFAFNRDVEIDLIIIDNRSEDPEALQLLEELERDGARILEYREGFNYARINNLAAEFARCEALCFLNNDVEFFQHGVFAELLGRMAGPAVGAVAPLMVRASDVIQHGGVVLGIQHGASHAFEDRMLGDHGYADMLKVAHECSAVTGALMLTCKRLFDQCGGFDEYAFPINFNDVDYCLRLRAAGHRVVFTPHVAVRHFESVSRGSDIHSPGRPRMEREVELLRERWFDVIQNDPFYHPLFTLDAQPYRALSAVHRSPFPRTNVVRPSPALPLGF